MTWDGRCRECALPSTVDTPPFAIGDQVRYVNSIGPTTYTVTAVTAPADLSGWVYTIQEPPPNRAFHRGVDAARLVAAPALTGAGRG